MKRLILKKLTIICDKNEEAKVINFDRNLTIITSENPEGITINRTGKSLVIKSIYYALGAKLKKYTTNWKNLKLSTIINFKVDDKEYELYRNEERFILKTESQILFFKDVSSLREYFVELFNFKVRGTFQKNSESTTYGYPGCIFMPFYIDQDKGWGGSWDSFADVINSTWKKETLLYHLGVRTPLYYNLIDEKIRIETEQKDNKQQEKTLDVVYKKHLEKYKSYLDINVNLEKFTEEIMDLTVELNTQLQKRNLIKEELTKCFNELREAKELYLVAEKTYNELLKDVDYIENNLLEENIICPICGTTHQNDIQTHFKMYSEVQECEDIIQSYLQTKTKIDSRLEKQSEKLRELEDYITNIENILNRKREEVTFKEIIIAEGSKSILKDLKLELDQVRYNMLENDGRLKEIRKELTTISKVGTPLKEKYLQNLKNNLLALNVVDIDPKELKDFKISFESGGNDLPCTIMAQIYAIYKVASKHSVSICAPIVLDAIFQQEPAKEKIDKIWNFITDNQPEDSQLIISTTELHDKKIKGTIIRLTTEQGALNSTDYRNEISNISWYKNQMLSMCKQDD